MRSESHNGPLIIIKFGTWLPLEIKTDLMLNVAEPIQFRISQVMKKP